MWKLTVSRRRAPHSYKYVVIYGDSLSDIAAALGARLDQNLYNVTVVGRVITITRVHGGAVSASFAITPDSQGGATVTPQLVFDAQQLGRRADRRGLRPARLHRRRQRRARLPAAPEHRQPDPRPGDDRRRLGRHPEAEALPAR